MGGDSGDEVGVGERETKVPAGLGLVQSACWSSWCLATTGEIFSPLKCTHILAMRLRISHKGTSEAGRVGCGP